MNSHNFYNQDNLSLFKATKFTFLVHSSQNVYKFCPEICYYITRGKEKAIKIKKVVEKEVLDTFRGKLTVHVKMVEREGSTLLVFTVRNLDLLNCQHLIYPDSAESRISPVWFNA